MQSLTHNKLPGAGPFYFKGNNIGILMIHGGGGGTCADLKYIAEEIHNKEGYSIYLPLLPGFGTSPEILNETPINTWKSALIEALSVINERCSKIIVGGHSMGGALALILVGNYKVDGAFTISAPIGIPKKAKLVPILKIFIKYHKIDSDGFKKATNNKWVGYNKIPLTQGTKMNKLIKEMKQVLSNIRCPVLLFQGCLDNVIKTNSMDYIYKNINSKVKRKIWLENNHHSILESPDQVIIVSELISFIKEKCS